GVVGERLLRALGIGLPAMKVAGGILLFLAAADMVRARGELRTSRAEQQAAARTEDISVFPLAIPLIAGPGAMTTMVLLQSAVDAQLVGVFVTEAALGVAVIVTFAALLGAAWVARLLGKTGANVAGRVLGVLLAALAAQIALDGLRQSLWQ
ncbi:MAG TPA: MarC family protein, partial [Terriglobales bacterium]|nr:MarC family protein [Terriglobales bacterium]